MVSKKPLYVAAASVCLSAALLMGGCTQAVTSTTDTVSGTEANRQYMSDVSQTVDELSNKLDGFVDAVSRNDTVSMKTQAESALKVVDQINAIEAPDDLSELKDGYDKACADLSTALSEYVDLAIQVEDGSYDLSAYSDKLVEIQHQYNDAIALLKETDEKAAGLE
jgi:uncharacterized phage infection (PIP) family protein YhgE